MVALVSDVAGIPATPRPAVVVKVAASLRGKPAEVALVAHECEHALSRPGVVAADLRLVYVDDAQRPPVAGWLGALGFRARAWTPATSHGPGTFGNAQHHPAWHALLGCGRSVPVAGLKHLSPRAIEAAGLLLA